MNCRWFEGISRTDAWTCCWLEILPAQKPAASPNCRVHDDLPTDGNAKTGTQRREDRKKGTQRRKDARAQREEKKRKKEGYGERKEMEKERVGEGRGMEKEGDVFWFWFFPCVFASLRSLPPAFPFEPLCSPSRVVFLWANRQSECFGEAVQGVGCRSGIDGMSRLSIAEDFTQTSDVRIGDLCRIASQLLGKLDGLDHSGH